MDFKNQKIVQTFSSKNTFYLISITKETNLLHLNSIDSKWILTTHSIDLSENEFYNSENVSSTLFSVLNERISSFDRSFEIPLIDNNNLTSLSVTSKKRKCYFDEKQIIFTIDSNLKDTQLININLSDFSYNYKLISQIATEFKEIIKSNSLIVENKL